MPEVKEVSFFTNAQSTALDWEKFAQQHFTSASADLAWGKATPQYMMCPNSPYYIKATMPHVKLIAILREPVSRAYSHYQMAVRRNTENRSFDDAVAQQIERKALSEARRLRDPVSAIAQERDYYVVSGEYGRILRPYFENFLTAQLLVLFLEEFSANPFVQIKRIFRFLGVESEFLPPNLGERYHESGGTGLLATIFTLARQMPISKPVWRALAPTPFKHWIRNKVGTYRGQFPVKTSPMSEQTRVALSQFYREDTLLLKALVGRSLPWPGYL
jgi:hypothetical protein